MADRIKAPNWVIEFHKKMMDSDIKFCEFNPTVKNRNIYAYVYLSDTICSIHFSKEDTPISYIIPKKITYVDTDGVSQTIESPFSLCIQCNNTSLEYVVGHSNGMGTTITKETFYSIIEQIKA